MLRATWMMPRVTKKLRVPSFDGLWKPWRMLHAAAGFLGRLCFAGIKGVHGGFSKALSCNGHMATYGSPLIGVVISFTGLFVTKGHDSGLVNGCWTVADGCRAGSRRGGGGIGKVPREGTGLMNRQCTAWDEWAMPQFMQEKLSGGEGAQWQPRDVWHF